MRAAFGTATGAATRAETIALARRQTSAVVVLFIDINHLKQVNDTHGHDADDALLKDLADRLRAHARGADLVARWGGDEFVLLGQVAAPADAKTLRRPVPAGIRHLSMRVDRPGGPTVNDYYAFAYTNLRLAELRAEARRERFIPTRFFRVHRGRAVGRLGAALRSGPPAPTPVACCA